jgi:AraC-like DNA-binding protein
MSRLRKRGDLKAPRLFAYLVDCDGVNAPGGDEGALEGARLWFTLRGRYEVTTARGRRIGDPATVLLTRDREPYRLLHPDGCGDRVLAVGGELTETVALHAPLATRLAEGAFACIHGLAARLSAHAPVEPVEIEQAVHDAFATLPRAARVTRRARDLAEDVACEIDLRFDEPLSLAELVAQRGVSVFALCRAFRAAHGESIHRRQQRVRVRHALALALETSWGLADIAAECGFASHAHLTSTFRRLLGVTPSEARRKRASCFPRAR